MSARLVPAPWLVLAALLLAGTAPAVSAKPASGKPDDAPSPAAPEKPFQDWKKLTRDAEVKKGFLTLYRKRESLYAEIAPEQLGRDFLGVFSLARGIGSNFVLGGLPIGDHLLRLERAGDHVLLIEVNTRFRAPSGTPIDRARDLSYGNSVLASLKIESEQDSTRAVLVDLAPALVSDLADIAEGMRGALGNKPVRFDKDRSALGSVKAFPDNDEIEALLTYSPNDRTGLSVEGVPDERFIPITVHYSFSRLPEVPMTPRLADDRVGYFLTAYKDFARDQNESFWVRVINRWRLEKKDPGAALSEPVKPIVFYIDRTVPQEYRAWVKEGVEAWQKAFEGAGFKDAIVARDAPDDPSWDPEDVRYSTLRWITSSRPAFGAIGPSRVDPRTGEILDADILFEAALFQNQRNGYRRWVGPDALARSILPETQEWPAFVPLEQRCDAQAGLADASALMRTQLLLDGAIRPGDPVPPEYMHQAVVQVVMHEVGHTLGLRHNFRGSTATPYDQLQDTQWTRAHGLTNSVMEYPSANIAGDRAHQGDYWTTGLGTYDLWAIRYGYTPTGQTGDADYAAVRPIADESMQPGHEYSTDEDTYPADAPDPRANIYDLGDDPLRFARDRTALIRRMWASGKLEERVVGPDGEYPTLRRAMDTLLQQYGIALGLTIKYLGGSEVSRNHRGQPGAVDPLRPVPAARQREALDLLAQRAFAADAFGVAPALLDRLGPDRWSHWGVPSTFGTNQRQDYDLGDRAFAIQSTLLGAILAPTLMARLEESESRSPEAYRLKDLFDGLTRALWGEVGGGPATAAAFRALEGPNTRRDVQRAYVDRLAGLVVSPPAGTPDDARALARLQLQRIDARCARVLAGEAPLGDYTRAHLLEARARIRRALEAGRQADVPVPTPPGGVQAAPGQR